MFHAAQYSTICILDGAVNNIISTLGVFCRRGVYREAPMRSLHQKVDRSDSLPLSEPALTPQLPSPASYLVLPRPAAPQLTRGIDNTAWPPRHSDHFRQPPATGLLSLPLFHSFSFPPPPGTHMHSYIHIYNIAHILYITSACVYY